MSSITHNSTGVNTSFGGWKKKASAVRGPRPGGGQAAPPSGGSSSSLGINGKKVRHPGRSEDFSSSVVRRYALLKFAAELALIDRDRKWASIADALGCPIADVPFGLVPKPLEVAYCSWVRWRPEVDVLRQGGEAPRARYRGIKHCHSVSACPVCAVFIAEARRQELDLLVGRARSQGYVVALASLTIPHGFGDDLHSLLDELGSRHKLIKRDRRWRRLESVFGLDLAGTGKKKIQMVRGFENTWSEFNGHHPHLHDLCILPAGADVGQFERDLAAIWCAYDKSGNAAVVDNAVRVTCSDADVAEYISKWGHSPRWDVGSEVAKSHVKRGRGTGRSTHFTMFQLLEMYAETKSMRYGGPWLEFVNAVFGMHHLHWSHGLRDWAGVVARSDEEVTEDCSEYPELVFSLSADDWRLVREMGRRGELLAAAAQCGSPECVVRFLAALRADFLTDVMVGRRRLLNGAVGPPGKGVRVA